MKAPIKIIHIDADYQVVYFLILEGTLIKSTVPLEVAIPMLKTEHFDLILFEPGNKALLTPQTSQEPECTLPSFCHKEGDQSSIREIALGDDKAKFSMLQEYLFTNKYFSPHFGARKTACTNRRREGERENEV